MAIAVKPDSRIHETDDARQTNDTRRDVVRIIAIVATIAPFAALVVRIWSFRSRPFVPFGDYALLEIQLRDFGSHLPLLGAYSRFGWSHPGPLATWMLEPIYLLTGRFSLSMWIGGACINAAACVAVVMVAFRRLGRFGGVLGSGVLAVYLVYLGPLGMSDPWNPILSILPFLALIFCLWDAWCGGRWVWLAIATLAAFVVQSHVQYLAPTIAMVGVVLLVRGVRYLRVPPGERRSPWPVVGAASAVFVVLWLPPMVQQFTGDPGNLGVMFRYLATGRGQQHSWGESASLAVREVTAPVSLFVNARFNHILTELPGAMPGVIVVVLVLLVIAVALVVVRRQGDLAGLFVVASLGWCVAVVQCTRAEGPLWLYMLAWISAFGVAFAVFATASIVSALRVRIPLVAPREHTARAIAIAVLAFIAAVTTMTTIMAPWRAYNDQAMVAPLAETVRGRLPRSGPVLITTGGVPLDFPVMALSAMLVRDGVDVRGPETLRRQFGWRAQGATAPVLHLQLVVVDPAQPPPDVPGATLYAHAGTLALYRVA